MSYLSSIQIKGHIIPFSTVKSLGGISCTVFDRQLKGVGIGEVTSYTKERTSPISSIWYDGHGVAMKDIKFVYDSETENITLKDVDTEYTEETENLEFLT